MERFEYISSIGEGAYGTVLLCKNNETREPVAMKRFKEAHVDREVLRLAMREIKLMKACQHQNVVRMLEAFRSKSGRVYVVMEYVERTLTQDLRKFRGGFPPLLLKVVAWQLLQVISFLHSKQVIHRDLKPANILLTSSNTVKICDFGFARGLHPRVSAEYTTYVVTRWYRPPEILLSDEYGPKVDIWAIGCLICEMASGRPLFPGKSSADQLSWIMRTMGPLASRQSALMKLDSTYKNVRMPGPGEWKPLDEKFPQFPPELMDLVKGCLALVPAQRLSAEQALAMPYFSDMPEIMSRISEASSASIDFWASLDSGWQKPQAATRPRAPVPLVLRALSQDGSAGAAQQLVAGVRRSSISALETLGSCGSACSHHSAPRTPLMFQQMRRIISQQHDVVHPMLPILRSNCGSPACPSQPRATDSGCSADNASAPSCHPHNARRCALSNSHSCCISDDHAHSGHSSAGSRAPAAEQLLTHFSSSCVDHNSDSGHLGSPGQCSLSGGAPKLGLRAPVSRLSSSSALSVFSGSQHGSSHYPSGHMATNQGASTLGPQAASRARLCKIGSPLDHGASFDLTATNAVREDNAAHESMQHRQAAHPASRHKHSSPGKSLKLRLSAFARSLLPSSGAGAKRDY